MSSSKVQLVMRMQLMILAAKVGRNYVTLLLWVYTSNICIAIILAKHAELRTTMFSASRFYTARVAFISPSFSL